MNLGSSAFIDSLPGAYDELREHRPVGRDRISLMPIYTLARYDDCAAMLNSPLVVRNRATATGGRRAPIPIPKRLQPMVESMITEDDPRHRHLRNRVRQAFRPQAIMLLENQLRDDATRLISALPEHGPFELKRALAKPFPTHAIARLMGVDDAVMPHLQQIMDTVTEEFSGWRILHTLFFRLPGVMDFLRGILIEKAAQPGADVLSTLAQPDADGRVLTQDEQLAMMFLLLIAGYETTTHLIMNGVHALITEGESWAELATDLTALPTAVEEIMRFAGPVHATKPNFALEPLTFQGVTIPRGAAIMPLLGAANRDPRAFPDPMRFDIRRTPNRHLGFGYGPHYCLGAHLARLEARIALQGLLAHFPRLRLSTRHGKPQRQVMPGWFRFHELWVESGR